MEENRRYGWSNLFLKIIIVIIFVLFTVWLLSISNKGLSNSLDVLTNNIFAQNMEKMKTVGKEYFTTERLPKKIGEIETLTLKEMYEKKLILELFDKNGNACDVEDSYVSVEKLDNEYQMKVNLECLDREEFIIVIMGCYDYCETDICEKVEIKEESSNKKIEYQYVKTTGGYWKDYGNWSDWSTVSVGATDYRQVETKKETEEYTYDKVVTKNEYVELNATCPSGYKKTSDGKKCYKATTNSDYASPVCPSVSGYDNIGRNGFACSYVKNSVDTITKDATCPSGYSKSGNNCVKTSTDTKNPTCPSVSGYTNTSRDGFTCNYVKTSTDTKNPICPSVSGYTMTERNGFTCNYTKWVKGNYIKTDSGERVPGNTTKYIYEEVGSAEYVYDCNNGCAFRWIHTWKVYEAKISTTTKTATCPSGYSKSGSTCAKSTTDTTTKTATCPSGYTKSGNSCIKTSTDTKNPTCPSVSGYNKIGQNGFTCTYSKTVVDNKTQDAVCPSGYSKSGNSCIKTVTDYDYKNLTKTCPSGYKKTWDGSQCYREVENIIKETATKEEVYYRYRIREYVGGSSDYKWSTSKSDKSLLNAGYRLTGVTR